MTVTEGVQFPRSFYIRFAKITLPRARRPDFAARWRL